MTKFIRHKNHFGYSPYRLAWIASFIFMVGACGPVESGKWYDSERNYDTFTNIFNKSANPRAGVRKTPKSASSPASTIKYSDAQTVTVRGGDTYYSLARSHNLSVRDLIESNNAQAPYILTKGQRLRIPSRNLYIVKKGDTLYSISRKFNLDISTLAKNNQLKPPYHLKIRQKLKVAGNFARQRRDTSKTIKAPPARKGKFISPAKGRLISSYGVKANGVHNDGINIAMPVGTNIRAAENGVVVYTGNALEGYGNLILLKHADNYITAYAHIKSFSVKVGHKVKRGQIIGQSGKTGNVRQPQLHFEIRKGVRALNPNNYI